MLTAFAIVLMACAMKLTTLSVVLMVYVIQQKACAIVLKFDRTGERECANVQGSNCYQGPVTNVLLSPQRLKQKLFILRQEDLQKIL